ncbi:hypothetical protein HQ524_03375 [Candidatus Uhrbacteria bacterium]|nr:hypothetical protein [Candidatus Uhrbacteria bacterium]
MSPLTMIMIMTAMSVVTFSFNALVGKMQEDNELLGMATFFSVVSTIVLGVYILSTSVEMRDYLMQIQFIATSASIATLTVPSILGAVIGISLRSPINWFTEWRYPELRAETGEHERLEVLIDQLKIRKFEIAAMQAHNRPSGEFGDATEKIDELLKEQKALPVTRLEVARAARRQARVDKKAESKRIAREALERSRTARHERWAEREREARAERTARLEAEVNLASTICRHGRNGLHDVLMQARDHKSFWKPMLGCLNILFGDTAFIYILDRVGLPSELERLLKARDAIQAKIDDLPPEELLAEGMLVSIDIGGVRAKHVRHLNAVNACIDTLMQVLQQLPSYISAINLDIPVALRYAEEKRDEIVSMLANLMDNIEMTIGLSKRRAENKAIAHSAETRALITTGQYEAAIALAEVNSWVGETAGKDPNVALFEEFHGQARVKKVTK